MKIKSEILTDSRTNESLYMAPKSESLDIS